MFIANNDFRLLLISNMVSVIVNKEHLNVAT